MKTKILLVSVPVAAAAGLGFILLRKKASASATPKAASPAPGKTLGKAAPAAAPASLKEGIYSFISGFRNAETVEVRCQYDGSRFSFAVLEEGFPVESGDSHVAVLSGEDFSMQTEYGSYYAGEDFDRLKKELAARHDDLKEVAYGDHSGILYQNGDNLCLDFPIPGDDSSFLHVTLMKEKGNDDPLSALPDYADVKAMLSSLSFSQG